MTYQKINVAIPPLDITRIKGDYVEQYGTNHTSYKVKDLDYVKTEFSKFLDFTIPADEILYVEIINEGAIPHIDFSKTSLNYYFDDCKAVTIFWNKRKDTNEAKLVNDINHDETIKIYNENELIPIGSFCAEPYSLYLLDIGKIHSVKKTSYTTIRKTLRMLWYEKTLAEIFESIKIKN